MHHVRCNHHTNMLQNSSGVVDHILDDLLGREDFVYNILGGDATDYRLATAWN